MQPMKEYLGDGVYVVWDGHNITLTTEDGSQLNRIVLAPEVLERYLSYLKQWTAQAR
jgi:hypothetical protein